MLKDEGSVSFIVYSCAESDQVLLGSDALQTTGTMTSTMIHLSTLTCVSFFQECWSMINYTIGMSLARP